MNKFRLSISNLSSPLGQSALEYIVLLGTLGALVAFSGPFFTRVQAQANATFGSAVNVMLADPNP